MVKTKCNRTQVLHAKQAESMKEGSRNRAHVHVASESPGEWKGIMKTEQNLKEE